jgi:signal peptidase
MVKSLDEINLEFEKKFPIRDEPSQTPKPAKMPSYEMFANHFSDGRFYPAPKNSHRDNHRIGSGATVEVILNADTDDPNDDSAPAVSLAKDNISRPDNTGKELPHIAFAEKRERRRQHSRKRMGNAVFYLALVIIILGTVLIRNIAGYSFYTVLTPSMQSVIPQGSLVITKRTDPVDIKKGDDITYLREDNSTVTHRVINIIENYDDTGERGFETKGTENELPDPRIVFAANVVGVVKVSVPGAGVPLYWVAEHIFIILGVFAVLVILYISLRTFFAEVKKDKTLKTTV